MSAELSAVTEPSAPSDSWFELPPDADATQPPEARGVARDHVGLLVAMSSGIDHTRFARIGDHLQPGDLVVVNDSATLPAAVDGRAGDGTPRTVHFCSPVPGRDRSTWLVELRPGRRATEPVTDARVGDVLTLPDGVAVGLLHGYPHGASTSERLWA